MSTSLEDGDPGSKVEGNSVTTGARCGASVIAKVKDGTSRGRLDDQKIRQLRRLAELRQWKAIQMDPELSVTRHQKVVSCSGIGLCNNKLVESCNIIGFCPSQFEDAEESGYSEASGDLSDSGVDKEQPDGSTIIEELERNGKEKEPVHRGKKGQGERKRERVKAARKMTTHVEDRLPGGNSLRLVDSCVGNDLKNNFGASEDSGVQTDAERSGSETRLAKREEGSDKISVWSDRLPLGPDCALQESPMSDMSRDLYREDRSAQRSKMTMGCDEMEERRQFEDDEMSGDDDDEVYQ